MPIRIRREHHPELPATPVMALQDPQERPFVAEERAAKRLAVTSPQILFVKDPAKASNRCAPQRDEDRVIQPDDRGRSRPHKRPHRAIVAFDHPRVARDHRFDLLLKVFALRPVLSPMQPVELDVLAPEALCKLSREVCLARAGASDDDNSRMFG